MPSKKELINRSRSIYYGLFSSLFVFAYDEDRFNGVKETVELLMKYPLTDEAEEALKNIYDFVKDGYDKLSDQYDRVFFDPASPIRTTASYYDEGYESGRKRVEMINYILKTDIRRNEEKYTDTEDDIGFICTFMYYLITNAKPENEYEKLQKEVFKNILNPFVDAFADSLIEYEKSGIFRDIAVLLKEFMEFERIYFDVPKPLHVEERRVEEKVLPYTNLKRRGRHRPESDLSCEVGIEEEEPVEEDV